MNMSFIVRRGVELKAAGATVLQAALSIELVTQVLGALKKRKRVYDPVTTWLTFLRQTLATDHSCRNAVSQARAAGARERQGFRAYRRVLPGTRAAARR